MAVVPYTGRARYLFTFVVESRRRALKNELCFFQVYSFEFIIKSIFYFVPLVNGLNEFDAAVLNYRHNNGRLLVRRGGGQMSRVHSMIYYGQMYESAHVFNKIIC